MLAFVGSAIGVDAGTINSSWKGGTGNWSVATDWTPNGVPNNGGGNTFNVTIDSGGTDLVTLNQNATIASLVLGGTPGTSTLQNLSGTAENLTVSGERPSTAPEPSHARQWISIVRNGQTPGNDSAPRVS